MIDSKEDLKALQSLDYPTFKKKLNNKKQRILDQKVNFQANFNVVIDNFNQNMNFLMTQETEIGEVMNNFMEDNERTE